MRASITAIFFFLLRSLADAQTNAPIIPTATVAMGDAGGKIFGLPFNPARTRHYYIEAEKQLWDFAPDGQDMVCGKAFPQAVAARRATMKTRYVEYVDATFSKRMTEGQGLGILGPVLRGMVGEDIAITFWNRTDVPLSMHPHGLKYDKDNEGSYYQPKPGLGAAVAPEAKFTYVWRMDEASGPLPSEPSSKAWLYHSHVAGDEEVNLGLIGFIIVTDPKRARPDGTPADVDRELASLFMIFDETGLTPDEEEAAEHAAQTNSAAPGVAWAHLQEQKEEGERYAINGRIFGNLSGLEMNEGERVRWYLFGLGSENDFHTPHWHGLRVTEGGSRRDVVELLPASMKVADMNADNPGSWLFHCHVAEHMMEGMFARVIVHGKESLHRAPEPAFFGLPASSSELQISRSASGVDFSPSTKQPCVISLEGETMIPDAFQVAGKTVSLQLAGGSQTFKLDRGGSDENARGSFRVLNASKNSSEFGLVYGGSLKFTVELSGADWLAALTQAGLKPTPGQTQEIPVPLTLTVGDTKHSTTIRLHVSVR